MNKYKIKRNKLIPGDEKINKHKDFNKLLNNYNDISNYKKATRPLYKNKKFLIFIISLAVVLLAIFLEDKTETSSGENDKETADKIMKQEQKK